MTDVVHSARSDGLPELHEVAALGMPLALEARRQAVGRAVADLDTPALLLDVDAARRNIERMARRMRALPAALRPHVKVHKSPILARLQVEAGAIGVATATAWEAVVMARSGIQDVLVANEVVGPERLAALARAACDAHITVAADSRANLDALSAAAQQGGSEIGILVDVDVGLGRCGVRSATEAVALAQHLAGLPGLRFRGVMGYEGHCVTEPDRRRRSEQARAAMDYLGAVVDELDAAGFPSQVVSAGGTGTYDITGANPRVTEIQAGSYVCMDAFHASITPEFELALTVLATVVSRHGDTVVLDAGRKSIGMEDMLPQVVGHEATPAFLHEEHAGFVVGAESPLAVGDRVQLMTGYSPLTVVLHDAYYVVSDSVVVDVWPILARGPGMVAGV